MPKFTTRLQHAWNAFFGRDAPRYEDYGPMFSYRPDKRLLRRSSDRSIATAIYNRIAMDVAAVMIKHVRVDVNDRYVEEIRSGLNTCLTLDANLDQTGRALIQDAVFSMFDEGVVALVPVDTTLDPTATGSYDIQSMRVAKIVAWYPENIRVELYNQKTGRREEIVLPKKICAIIENPLYSVMNEPNSTMQRLIRKLNLMDAIDEQASAGKLDLIIQLPYVVKTEQRRAQAEKRRKDIEQQLAGSKYGIAYTDGTEKITQLNRSLENNLLSQIEFLTNQLYNQLGLTEDVFKGIANEQAMLNYNNRTIEPILAALCDEMTRKFLTKTARTQGQVIKYFNEPFKLVPVDKIADIADKFTRNEILSPNEIRGIVGFKPVEDEQADELRNRNINKNSDGMGDPLAAQPMSPEEYNDFPEEQPEVAMSGIRVKTKATRERHKIRGQPNKTEEEKT